MNAPTKQIQARGEAMHSESQYLINQARQMRKRCNKGLAQKLHDELLTFPCMLKINYGKGGCQQASSRFVMAQDRTIELPIPCCEECGRKMDILIKEGGRKSEHEYRAMRGAALTAQAWIKARVK